MYNDLKAIEGDNPTIGIILCTEKDETIVRYSVLAENEQLFASKYRLYLPQEEELVQLIDRKDSRVGTFSGGMKRRLALGRALLHDPQLVYLDEPTLGVDVQARRVIWDYILSLRDQGKTVLITTNYLEEAQALCERLAIIDHGKLMAVDTPEHLKQTYGGSVIQLETVQPVESLSVIRALQGVQEVKQEGIHLMITIQGVTNIVPEVINIVLQEGELREITVREPNLEEIFLRLTGTALRD